MGRNWGGLLQPAAAAAMLVLMASSLVWMGSRLGEAPVPPVSGAGRWGQRIRAGRGRVLGRHRVAGTGGCRRAARARRVDERGPARLIDDIDSAIGEAREALAQEPGDPWSQESLLEALGSKVALLQDTVALLGEAGGVAEEFNP